MKDSSILLLIILVFSWNGCKIFQPASKADDEIIEVVMMEERDLDTLYVEAEAPKSFNPPTKGLARYNSTHKQIHDLLHTKLAVRFDWQKQYLFGKATLKFKPHFYSSNELVLDAKGFDIHRVSVIKNNDTTDLKHTYNQTQIIINLDKDYNRKETYTVFIDYTAKPTERNLGGSSAISSDQGLYFVNHDGKIKDKPQQIWTQGETEANSAWFPTIDKPNERCTQEMYITVQDKFITLSNGLLLNSTKNTNGTRTDYWKMNQPHAPYLFMMTVGEFAVVKDEWKGKEVSYYVEPRYEAHARAIFSNTKEMLSFFSEKLGMDYPWDKYAQIVVRDYVSGAMENTTGVIFGKFVQKTERELIDNHNENIVAHELIHHWFGDLVTCESWANLALNESFANYGEYLWLEYKYGKDEADHHMHRELGGYLYTSDRNMHDLINFSYADREDMFDAHSYNKGGCILHSLRNYIGDDAFFAGLNMYLKTHAWTAVESHDLRLAFEKVTGEDLNWFFNQWFFSTGHPELDVIYSYDTTLNKAIVTVKQTQSNSKFLPIFQLPLALDIYTKKGVERHEIWINQREQIFSFDVAEAPKLMNLDADKILVGTIKENKMVSNYIYQYHNAPTFLDRYNAILNLINNKNPLVQETIFAALSDKYWAIQNLAISHATNNEPTKVQLRKMLTHPHSGIRTSSVNKLTTMNDTSIVESIFNSLSNQKELSYPVMTSQIAALQALAPKYALRVAEKLKGETYQGLVIALGEIYAESGDIKHLPFFYENANNVSGFYSSSFFEAQKSLLFKANENTIDTHSKELSSIAKEDDYAWKRFHAAKVIYSLANHLKEQNLYSDLVLRLERQIAIIKSEEQNSRIQTMYKGW